MGYAGPSEAYAGAVKRRRTKEVPMPSNEHEIAPDERFCEVTAILAAGLLQDSDLDGMPRAS